VDSNFCRNNVSINHEPNRFDRGDKPWMTTL
jgi:hypothetical protein